ncbi:MAG: hypothetical protein KDD55_01115 [Bdellovibrionales bacterium]|nr:hypothetical protein [Bdellovibrionales bacterium]
MSSKIDVDSQESWQHAMKIAKRLFVMPQRVLLPIRLLWRQYLLADHDDVDVKIDPAAYASVRLIDSTVSFKAPLYFAASQLRRDQFSVAEDDTSKALLKTLGPGLFSVLLALVWLYRRAAKLSAPSQWVQFSPDILANLEIAIGIADETDKIGSADGALLGAIRHMALGGMLVKNEEHFKRYSNLHIRNGRFDFEDEHTRWKCDHAQVATCLLQLYTFTRTKIPERRDLETPMYVRSALLGKVEEIPKSLEELVVWARFIRLLDSINEKRGGGEVDFSWLGIDEHRAKELNALIRKVYEEGSSFSWLKRGAKLADDMDKHKQSLKGEKEPAAGLEGGLQEEDMVPTEPIDPSDIHIPGFSQEELEGLTQEELQQLKEFADMASE